MSDCQCPSCRSNRGAENVPPEDFLEQSRIAAARALPQFKAMIDSLYGDDFNKSVISLATFRMLAAASLFHQATVEMAAESGRAPDEHAMVLGIRQYAMSFHMQVEIATDNFIPYGAMH